MISQEKQKDRLMLNKENIIINKEKNEIIVDVELPFQGKNDLKEKYLTSDIINFLIKEIKEKFEITKIKQIATVCNYSKNFLKGKWIFEVIFPEEEKRKYIESLEKVGYTQEIVENTLILTKPALVVKKSSKKQKEEFLLKEDLFDEEINKLMKKKKNNDQ
jgi:hypothetical protein